MRFARLGRTRPPTRSIPKRADDVRIIRMDLDGSDLAPAARTLSGALASVRPWLAGKDPPRFRRHGLYACLQLRDAVSCLQYFFRNPVTPDLRASAAAECREAADRLWRHRGIWTAAAFVEAACLIEPNDARHPLELGRLYRMRADFARAWAWYGWAARLARRHGDGATLSTALLRMGRLAHDEDAHALAGRLYKLARAVARRYGCRAQEGDALVALGLLRYALDHRGDALEHFREAVDAYEPGSDRLPVMGLRVAERWLAEGQFRGAAGLLLPAVHHAKGETRLASLAAAARASAALGLEWEYEGCWCGTWLHMGCGSTSAQVDASIQLARAAANNGDWTRAQQRALAVLNATALTNDTDRASIAGRMFVAAMMPKEVGEAACDEAFPDLRAIRLGLVDDWEDDDEPEPWLPVAPVRALVDAFVRALTGGAPADPHTFAP